MSSGDIDTQLNNLPETIRNILVKSAFNSEQLKHWSQRLLQRIPNNNRVSGVVTPPNEVLDVRCETEQTVRYRQRGIEALQAGEVAFIVLAGGMATRMGGVVKALVEALPGIRFLDYRLKEIDVLAKSLDATVPLWLMTSYATEGPIQEALQAKQDGTSRRRRVGELASFRQFLSLRLTAQGNLFHGKDGQVSMYAPGHGDLPEALIASGLLDRFIERGGRTLCVANIDNLGASIDPVILGAHLCHQAPISVEVVDKVGSDKGGIPAQLDGRPVILEDFRLPETFDASAVRMFNTNTFWIDARALRACTFAFTYFEVKKKVDDREAIQFERLLGELTSALDTRFLRVSRDGVSNRFLPVKDGAELLERRPAIEAIAKSRQVIDGDG